jgi:hypothetical protein
MIINGKLQCSDYIIPMTRQGLVPYNYYQTKSTNMQVFFPFKFNVCRSWSRKELFYKRAMRQGEGLKQFWMLILEMRSCIIGEWLFPLCNKGVWVCVGRGDWMMVDWWMNWKILLCFFVCTCCFASKLHQNFG